MTNRPLNIIQIKNFRSKKCSHVGFIKTVSPAQINVTSLIKVNQKLTEQERERKSEKSALLEFLESSTRRMDNQISKDNGKNYINPPVIFGNTDI